MFWVIIILLWILALGLVLHDAIKDKAGGHRGAGAILMKQPTNQVSLDPNSYKSKINSILEKIKGPSDEPNAERMLGLFKMGVEAEKLEAEKSKVTVDASLAARQLRLAYLSTITSQLVPLAALLAVVVTFYGSYQQNKQARITETAKLASEAEAREHAEWEAFKSSFDSTSADDLYKKPTFVSRLKIFIASGKHSSEILDITRPLLGDLTNKSGFNEIWANTYRQITPENFDNVISVARAIRNKYDKVTVECGTIAIPPNTIPVNEAFKLLGPCFLGYTYDLIAKAYADKPELAKRVSVLRDQTAGLNSILSFLSEKITAYVKATSTTKIGAKSYDLSEIIFTGSNLDDVDFSKMNIAQTRFYLCSMKGTILTGPPDQLTYDFQGTAWWEAASINNFILPFLIANAYPGSPIQLFVSQTPSGAPLTEDQYQEQVQRLCVKKSGWCDRSCLKFGIKPNDVQATCSPGVSQD